MCAPAVIEKVRERISRRKLLKGIGAAGAAVAGGGCVTTPSGTAKGVGTLPDEVSFGRVVDLSHTLHPGFPAWFTAGQEMTTRANRTFVPPAIVEVKPVFEWEHEKVNLNRVTYWEHVGTHMDAPAHFSEGSTVEKIPAEDLVLPLAVIDITARADKDPLAQVQPRDIRDWEAKHGRIPERACVAMNSG